MSFSVRPKQNVATFTLSSRGTGVVQRVQVGGSSHTFEVDAAEAFGGRDSAPSPIAYALGALISCTQVTAQLAAKDFGIVLNGFEFEVSGELDTAVLVNGASEGNANFERVIVNATIATSASDDELARLKTETERRCPISQLFLRSGVDVRTVWNRVPTEFYRVSDDVSEREPLRE